VNQNLMAEANVMDEAFASFEDTVDCTRKPAVDKSLATALAAQLEALDRQREHLANLLRSVEVRGETSLSAAF
jgi:hypothetical protein